MPPEPTNLLPPERARAFRREYFYRLATLAAFALVLLIGIHSVLLLPTHMLLVSQIAAHEQQLAALSAAGTSPDKAAFEKRLAALSASAKALIALDAAPSAIDALSKVLAVPHPGVVVDGLSFVVAGGSKKVPTATVSGTALERDGLRRYQLALQSEPFVAAVDLPVSTYAKDTDISFTLTLTFTSVAP